MAYIKPLFKIEKNFIFINLLLLIYIFCVHMNYIYNMFYYFEISLIFVLLAMHIKTNS